MPNEEFEKWWNAQKWQEMNLGTWGIKMVADDAWKARQPEIDALKVENNKFAESNVELLKENAALKAENERLRADAERLDFVARSNIDLSKNDYPEGILQFIVYRITGWPNDREWHVIGRGKTYREAIDAAMKETK